MLTSDEFKQAKNTVEEIVKDEFDISTVKTVLKAATNEITPERQYDFYNHMSSLFLNVMLNRLNELGKNAKNNAIIGRQNITKLMSKNYV